MGLATFNAQRNDYLNMQGDGRFNYNFSMEKTLQLQHTEWFDIGILDLTINIIVTVINRDNKRAVNYTNPPRYRIGTMCLMSNGYVVTSQDLTYESQLFEYRCPTIVIAKSRNAFVSKMNRTTQARIGHSFSISGSPICGSVTESLPRGRSNLSATLPAGSICLRTFPAADQYQQEQGFVLPVNGVIMNLEDQGIPLDVVGCVEPGYDIAIESGIAINNFDSGATPVVPGVVITGDATFPTYSYNCLEGVPIPAASPGCPPRDVRPRYRLGEQSFVCAAVP